jgi:hypothetical protein
MCVEWSNDQRLKLSEYGHEAHAFRQWMGFFMLASQPHSMLLGNGKSLRPLPISGTECPQTLPLSFIPFSCHNPHVIKDPMECYALAHLRQLSTYLIDSQQLMPDSATYVNVNR